MTPHPHAPFVVISTDDRGVDQFFPFTNYNDANRCMDERMSKFPTHVHRIAIGQSDDERQMFTAYHEATDRATQYNDDQRAASAERDRIVADLHDLGYSYRQLAERLGVSHSRVQQMIQRHNAR